MCVGNRLNTRVPVGRGTGDGGRAPSGRGLGTAGRPQITTCTGGLEGEPRRAVTCLAEALCVLTVCRSLPSLSFLPFITQREVALDPAALPYSAGRADPRRGRRRVLERNGRGPAAAPLVGGWRDRRYAGGLVGRAPRQWSGGGRWRHARQSPGLAVSS